MGGTQLTPHSAAQNLFDIIWLILIARILLSWFPSVNWWQQPFKFVHDFTEPIFEPFRRMIPPISGLDLSPIVVFLLFNMLKGTILSLI